jgi:hypothetical protein
MASSSSSSSSPSSGHSISEPRESNPEKTVVFTYGRFQPPHSGHQRLINHIHERARELHATPYVIVSSSCTSKWFSSATYKKQQKANTFKNCKDINDNPLTMKQKLKYLRKMFPTTKFIPADKYGVNIFNVLGNMRDKGYTKFVGLFGSDREPIFTKMFKDDAERLKEKLAADPNFEKRPFDIKIEEAGDKRVDEGISATKLREAAVENNKKYFEEHTQIGNMTPKDIDDLMKILREALWQDKKEEDEEESKPKSKKKSAAKKTEPVEKTPKEPPRRSPRNANKPSGGGYIPPKVIHQKRPKKYILREDEKPI